MADDFAGDASTTGRIAAGSSSAGVLESNGDVDWFATSLSAGLLYQFDLVNASNFGGNSSDDISVLNSSGLQVAGTGIRDKTVQFTPANSGTYYIAVASVNFNGYGIGGYTLTEAAADDYTGDKLTTGRLTVGSSVSANLSPRSDVDWFRVSLLKGFNYRFDTAAAANFTSPTTLTANLRDSNGVSVASSRSAVYTPGADGDFYLSITSSSATGDYTVTTTGDDYSDDASTTGRLAVDSTATGTLESAGDDDWFAVSLVAGGTYKFSLAGFASTPSPNSLQFFLVTSSGSRLLNTGTVNSPLTFAPTASGVYYLDVRGGTTGSYQLTASTITPPPGGGGGGGGGGGAGALGGGGGGGGGGGTATTTTPVYRFFDTHFGTHFYTSDTGERDTILATRPDLLSEGVGLSALGQTSDPNVSAVYRFFDTIHGTQFLTSAATERDTIIATRSDLHYEGVSFYEYNAAIAGSAPVYRFFDSIYGTHFYTGSESERATIIATRSDLTPEGVAFYSPTS